MTRELAPWEIAVDGQMREVGPLTGMALAMATATSFGTPIGYRARDRYGTAKPKPEDPTTKRNRKAQKAARKARRRGEET